MMKNGGSNILRIFGDIVEWSFQQFINVLKAVFSLFYNDGLTPAGYIAFIALIVLITGLIFYLIFGFIGSR